MELLLVIPLAVAAAGLYWLLKPPHTEGLPNEMPEPAYQMPGDAENAEGTVATVHAAQARKQHSVGE